MNADHSNIVKFNNMSDQTYVHVRNYLADYLQELGMQSQLFTQTLNIKNSAGNNLGNVSGVRGSPTASLVSVEQCVPCVQSCSSPSPSTCKSYDMVESPMGEYSHSSRYSRNWLISQPNQNPLGFVTAARKGQDLQANRPVTAFPSQNITAARIKKLAPTP